ncbi:MAG: DUF3833 domain-containing protein [bacterium]
MKRTKHGFAFAPTFRTTFLFIVLSLFSLFSLSACSNMTIDDYAQTTPKLDLFTYFVGKSKGWGMFQDRGGQVKRQFVVDIQGEINAQGELVLTEDFVWNDGEISQRIWTIRRQGDNYYGQADDVIGEAKGEAQGNALNWRYDLNLPVGDKTYRVHFNDWMFLQDDKVLLNRAKMSKWGFTLGEVTIAFQRID